MNGQLVSNASLRHVTSTKVMLFYHSDQMSDEELRNRYKCFMEEMRSFFEKQNVKIEEIDLKVNTDMDKIKAKFSMVFESV